MVVPPGGGLVASPASDHRSANASRARVISPAVAWAASRVSRAVSATDSLMAGMRGGHGCPPRAGTGASPRGMRRSASLTCSSSPGPQAGGVAVPGAAGRQMAPADGVADGYLAELGEGGQGGVPVRPSQVRTWHWSHPSTFFPVLNVSSTGQRRPAMVMKYVMVAGLSSGAQHR